MNLLNKLTIKNLRLNKKRTIVTIIGIILSVALITAVSSMYASGIKSLIGFETFQKGNYHAAFYSVPTTDIPTFKNNRAIESLYITQDIGYAKIDSKNEYKPYAFIKGFTNESLNNLSIKLVEGRLPENSEEIVIPTHLKTNGRLTLKVGDTITLDVGKRVSSDGYELKPSNLYQNSNPSTGSDEEPEKLVDTHPKTYKIVGIIERPASSIESYSAPGYTFITLIDEQNLTGTIDIFARYNKKGAKKPYFYTAQILNIDANSLERYQKYDFTTSEEFQKYRDEVSKAKYQYTLNDYLIILETNPIRDNTIGGLGSVVGIVIAIIIFTSIFCIKNSFAISITEKTKQYGMLKSIGATKKQIKKNVFYEATILGLIGIPLGILSGLLASYILIIVCNFFLKDMISEGLKLVFALSPLAIIVSILLGIITIYFSALRSAKKATKVSPIDSIRNSSDIKIKSKKLKAPKCIRRIFGMGGEISYKNLKRNRKKYRTTTISIIVSVFIFIALSGFMNMAFSSIKNELNIQEYNLSVDLVDSKDNNDISNKYNQIVELPYINEYAIYHNYNLEIEQINYTNDYLNYSNFPDDYTPSVDDLLIYIVDDHTFQNYVESIGLKPEEVGNKAILYDYYRISSYDEKQKENIAHDIRVHNYQEGDQITGKIYGNSDQETTFTIGAITNQKPFGVQTVYYNFMVINSKYYSELNIGKTTATNIYIDSNNATKLQDEIEKILVDEDYTINNSEENVKMMRNLFTLIGIFLYGFIIVITLIGVTNIFNTITTNMELRRQEFAMLKSIGMTTKEFNHMIRLESLFMGCKSLIFGIPIGIALSYIIYIFLRSTEEEAYHLPFLAIAITIIAVFLLITVIMKYSLNKINKQNTIETIRNENI